MTEEAIRDILSGWTDLSVSRAGEAWVIAGLFGGKAHAGGRVDGVGLAHDLQRIAEAEATPPRPEPEDEDPGEQDLGAEMLAAEDEAEQDSAFATADDAATESLNAGGDNDAGRVNPPDEGAASAAPSAFSGTMLLPDELGARRNAVLAAIATEKLTRLKIAMDPSQAAFLSERFAEYQNRGALGLDIDEALNADRQAYLDMRDRQQAIYYYAMHLEQSALDGDMDRLSAMHAGLSDGWP